jgi:hypothetical protein
MLKKILFKTSKQRWLALFKSCLVNFINVVILFIKEETFYAAAVPELTNLSLAQKCF